MPSYKPSGRTAKRVVIVQEHVPHYRRSFFTELKRLLDAEHLKLEVLLNEKGLARFIDADLDWMTKVPVLRIGRLAWHRAWNQCKDADLVILPQEAKYGLIYILIARRAFGPRKVALWGHGRGFQARGKCSASEWIKKEFSTRVDWWFAYNDLSARVVEALGFPSDRITPIYNSIDTAAIQKEKKRWDNESLSRFKSENGLKGDQIAIFTGGLHEEKRIGFLLEAAKAIRNRIPTFELIIIGEGPEKIRVEKASADHPWIKVFGKLDDLERIPHWMVSRLALMPGLVGLVVVDSFVFGVPLITTDYKYHSPEIDYLKDGVNGLLVKCGDDSNKYAEKAALLLGNPLELSRLRRNALSSCAGFSAERMAEKMAEGIKQALC